MLNIMSINVNGLRASVLTGKSAKNGYGLKNLIEEAKNDDLDIDILCLQELKATSTEIDNAISYLEIDSDRFYMAEDLDKKGHAGVGIAVLNQSIEVLDVRTPFDDINNFPQRQQIKSSGRWIEVDIKTSRNNLVTIICAYIHHADSPTATRKATKSELESGSKKDVLIGREISKTTMNNKHLFMQNITNRIRHLNSQNKRIIMVGDFNIAHHKIDIKNADGNKTKAGFLPQERAWLDLWFNEDVDISKTIDKYKFDKNIDYQSPKECEVEFKRGYLGLIDICRKLWGASENSRTYTWWTYMGRAFDNDAGWRIDYHAISKDLEKYALKAKVYKQPSYSQRYTDHAGVLVSYDL